MATGTTGTFDAIFCTGPTLSVADAIAGSEPAHQHLRDVLKAVTYVGLSGIVLLERCAKPWFSRSVRRRLQPCLYSGEPVNLSLTGSVSCCLTVRSRPAYAQQSLLTIVHPQILHRASLRFSALHLVGC